MPVWDWQFIVVSLVALVAVGLIVRQVVPRRSSATDQRAACANCPTHAESTKPSRTTVTPVVSLSDLRETARLKPRT